MWSSKSASWCRARRRWPRRKGCRRISRSSAKSNEELSLHHQTEGVMTAPALSLKELRRVVIAAAVGNVIEWYDFYIFGSLAALLATKFFAEGAGGAALIKTVGTFTAGFLVRPFGAFVFGRLGDIVGRK